MKARIFVFYLLEICAFGDSVTLDIHAMVCIEIIAKILLFVIFLKTRQSHGE